jgi:hypothetical protein
MRKSIEVAVAGVGNCANSQVFGSAASKLTAKDVANLQGQTAR